MSPNITDRPVQSEDDYRLMRGLLVAVLRHTGPPAYQTLGDLDWSRAVSDDAAVFLQSHLWFDGANLVAFAWPEEDSVDIALHPDYPVLYDSILAWTGAHYRDTAGDSGAADFSTSAFSRDKVRTAALDRHGFRRSDMGRAVYGQRITGTFAPPKLPPGYALRHVAGAAESEARAAVQRAAFESDFMSAERHRRVCAMPTYRPELDIVAVAPDGELAAFALIWFDQANRLGVFEPLGVAVTHQRRGLGRALMAEGIRRLAALGAAYACVATGILHDEARRLYEATGFELLDLGYDWMATVM